MDPLFHFAGDLWQLLAAYIWQNACQLQPLFCLELHKGTTFFFFFFCSFFGQTKVCQWFAIYGTCEPICKLKSLFSLKCTPDKSSHLQKAHTFFAFACMCTARPVSHWRPSTRNGFLWIMLRCLYKNNQKNNNEYLSYPPPPPPPPHACVHVWVGMHVCVHVCMHVPMCLCVSHSLCPSWRFHHHHSCTSALENGKS